MGSARDDCILNAPDLGRGDQAGSSPGEQVREMAQIGNVTGKPGQIGNDYYSGAARADRRHKCQRAGPPRVVGRFAGVLKDADEFDSFRLRERQFRCSNLTPNH